MSEAKFPQPKAFPRLHSRRLWRLLQWLGTALGFAYLIFVVDLRPALESAGRIPLSHIALAVGMVTLNLTIGTLRWRVLFFAIGLSSAPPFGRLLHLYFVGFFYNSFLPGGVGGDLVRGLATRKHFSSVEVATSGGVATSHNAPTSNGTLTRGGTFASITTVFLERLSGLSGLLILVAAALLSLSGDVASSIQVERVHISMISIAGIFVGIAGAALPLLLGRVRTWVPGRFQAALQQISSVQRPIWVGLALLLSLAVQVGVALTGYVILIGIAPQTTLAAAVVILPIAAASSFLPFTVGGAGAREAAFVELCRLVLDMPRSDALAASLVIWGVQLLVASSGGVMQVYRPLQTESRSSSGGSR
ncbi:MAG: lysylphosphatidylglycerol synthase transmembrane domain-containing protein [Myxococcota bacterium]